MRESTLINHLRKAVKKLGGKSLKMHGSVWGETGVPDLWLCVPTSRTVLDTVGYARSAWIEAKIEYGSPTPKQVWQIEDLRRVGERVFVVRGGFDQGAIAIVEGRDGIHYCDTYEEAVLVCVNNY